jgi:predicted nucleotidyltransferase
MAVITLNDVIAPLKKRKQFYHDQFGVVRIGIFGSFVEGRQTPTSDIDIVIEMKSDKKNLHNFLQFKRMLESEFNRTIDLGFEKNLKSVVSEKIGNKIVYV